MANIFLTVTDLELMASQAVKGILVLLLLFGGGFNLWKAFKAATVRWKVLRGCMAAVFILIALPVFRLFLIEDSLLRSPKYAVGVTLGYCTAFAKGNAIEFEYEVAGKKYRNCETFHPIPIDSITVPDGKYYVRYAEKYPGKGRIDFHKKAEQ